MWCPWWKWILTEDELKSSVPTTQWLGDFRIGKYIPLSSSSNDSTPLFKLQAGVGSFSDRPPMFRADLELFPAVGICAEQAPSTPIALTSTLWAAPHWDMLIGANRSPSIIEQLMSKPALPDDSKVQSEALGTNRRTNHVTVLLQEVSGFCCFCPKIKVQEWEPQRSRLLHW